MSAPGSRGGQGLYRLLVRLYPRAFRARFGRAMVEDFRELVEAEGTGPAWGRALRDAARSLPAAWARAARPSLRAAPSLRRLPRDLRFAARSLRRDPGFTLTAVAVLGLAIGVGTAVLGVVNAYLLRPLPYPHADRLVDVEPALPLRLDEAREVMEIPLTWELDAFTLVGGDRPEQVLGSWVTPEWFEAYGITPALGRAFRPDEWGEGATPVAVISHPLWQRRFGGDRGVLGRVVRTYSSDRPGETEVFTVVGVLPPDVWLHNAYTDFLVPIRTPNAVYAGRLRPDVPLERAEAVLTELARGRSRELEGDARVELTPLGERYTSGVRPALVLLSAAVLLVLLIACGNVALLSVVRAQRRDRELAVRRALGAGRGTLAAQLVTEGLVLAALAGGAGALVAGLALELLGSAVSVRLGLPVPGGPAALRLDATVLAALAGACGLVGLVCGLVPALGLGGPGPAGQLAAGGRSASPGRRRRRVQGAVMAVELALSLALLVAAGLTVRSARHVASLDLGFDPEGLVMAGLMLRERSYPQPADRVAFHERLADALRGLPDVASAGIAVRPPLGRSYAPRAVEAEGRPPAASAGRIFGATQVAGPGYLETLGLDVVQGRGFGPDDGLGAPRVALVSPALADALWPGEAPLGKRFREVGERDAAWRTVVGVVAEVRQDPMGEPVGDYYLPVTQEAPRYATVFLRMRPGATAPLPALERAVAALDPEVAVADATDVATLAGRITAPGRFLALLLGVFGAFAVGLAVVGLYGAVAYAAAQRRRDVAVRMALGARREEVARLFVRERLGVLGAGLALGLAGAVVLARLLQGQLRGVTPADPLTYGACALLLAGAAFAAVWIPARGAARAEPMRVLREE